MVRPHRYHAPFAQQSGCSSKSILSSSAVKTPAETPVKVHVGEAGVSETGKTRLNKTRVDKTWTDEAGMDKGRSDDARMEEVAMEKGRVETAVKATAESDERADWPPPAPRSTPTLVPRVASIPPVGKIIRIGVQIRIRGLVGGR